MKLQYEFAYVYILKCADDSFYTGYTIDIDRRICEHNEGSRKCKYTAVSSRRPVELAALWKVECPKRNAMSVEYFIKRLNRANKMKIVAEPSRLIELYDKMLYAKNKNRDFKILMDR